MGESDMSQPTLEEFKVAWEKASSPEELYEFFTSNALYIRDDVVAFVGYSNDRPTYVCNCHSTAARLILGLNFPSIEKRPIFSVCGEWYGPIELHEANSHDLLQEKAYADYKSVIEKAKAAGLTADDINIIRGNV
jgi:hypothetical protein